MHVLPLLLVFFPTRRPVCPERCAFLLCAGVVALVPCIPLLLFLQPLAGLFHRCYHCGDLGAQQDKWGLCGPNESI